MRVFMLTLFVGLTCAAPQGYNYQIELNPSGNAIQDFNNQYQFIQQQPQQQPQNFYQVQVPQQLQQLRETVALPSPQGAYQFGNQLLQSAQQVVQYEEQHQPKPEEKQQQISQQVQYEQQEQQQEPKEKQQQISQQAAIVIEQPAAEIVEAIKTPQPLEKPQIVTDTEPQFIIKSKAAPKHEVLYQAPAEEKPVTFQKEFYYLSAPKEEEEETPKDLDEQLSILQKKLRVVFIKAPENNGIEKAALQLAQQSANAQTAIYVLTKQHDAAELAQKFQSIQTSQPQSPEVAFIKYRTPEEAEHAQRVIQAQYESLDGPNHINRPNIGVTHNFVGANAAGVDPRKPLPTLVDGEKLETTKPVSKYLPASVRH